MNLTDCKVREENFNDLDISSLPSRPSAAGIGASALQERFDAGAKKVLAPALNSLIDILTGSKGAANIGATQISGLSGYTVQDILEAIKALLDTMKPAEEADREIAQKFDKKEAQALVKTIDFNESNGIFTITKYDGTVQTFDTALEKVALNVRLDGQQFVLTLVDGTEQRVDLSAFLTQTEVKSSNTITLSIANGAITAQLVAGSIKKEHLSDELTEYIEGKEGMAAASASEAGVQAENARLSAVSAEASKNAANVSEQAAKVSEGNAKTSETNAAKSAEQAEKAAEEAASEVEKALQKAKDSGVFKGDAGTSVTVKSVNESTVDGGSNVVTFSDGKTVTIKNGHKGSPGEKGEPGKQGNAGYTPVRGVDYYTEADTEALAQMVLDILGGKPVLGYIDENNNIILVDDLADGTYVFKYEEIDGTYSVIGSLVVGGVVQYSITSTMTGCTAVSGNAVIINEGDTVTLKYVANDGFAFTDTVAVSGASYTWDSETGTLVLSEPTADVTVAITATKSGYTNIIDTVGVRDNTRISTADGLTEKEAVGYCLTGMITMPIGSTLRTDGVDYTNAKREHSLIHYYNTDVYIGSYADSQGSIAGSQGIPVTNDGNGNLTIVNNTNHTLMIRLCGYGIGANLIVTINEEIVESGGTNTPSYTNLANPTAAGWVHNSRISSSGTAKDEGSCAGAEVTNYIFIPDNADTVYIKGLDVLNKLPDGNTPVLSRHSDMSEESMAGKIYCNNLTDELTMTGDITSGVLGDNVLDGEYLRFCGTLLDGYTADDVVITINEPIE